MDTNNEFQLSSSRPVSPVNKNKNGFWKSIAEWVQVIVVALIIALPIRWYIAEPFVVQGASMDPTFATGQFLIVDRLTYRFESPGRGDVLVFRYPDPVATDPKTYYIKRIIGLPGETVSINNGKVTIINKDNPKGIELNEPYISSSHYSFDSSSTTLDSNHYFVMGDNRAQSSDSRYWGPLDRDHFVGRPIVRLFPLNLISFYPGQESQ